MRIGGIIDMSTVDYPGKVCSVVFFHGCNFHCPFCYNVSLVEGNDYRNVGVEEVLKELEKARGFIDAVTITGGEPTMQPEDLIEFCRCLREMNLLVKLDTNGYNPGFLAEILEKNLVDFVSMDIKSDMAGYNRMSGIECDLSRIKKSVDILRSSNIEYEFRTTIVPGQNDKPSVIEGICDFIKPAQPYVLQQFRPGEGTLGNIKAEKMDKKKLRELAVVARENGLKVKIRTEEDGEESL